MTGDAVENKLLRVETDGESSVLCLVEKKRGIITGSDVKVNEGAQDDMRRLRDAQCDVSMALQHLVS